MIKYLYINSPHKISKWTYNYSKEIGNKYFGFIEVSIYVLVTSADQECDDLITKFTTHKLGALTFFPGGGGSRVEIDDQSPPSPIPGDLGRGPSHQSTART